MHEERPPRGTQAALAESELRFRLLLRVSRRLASEADARALLTALVDEAVAYLHADAGTVHRWDDQHGGLVAVYNTLLSGRPPVLVRVGQGAIGRAVQQRTPIVDDDYQREENVVPDARQVGTRAALAVPLLHQNQLLGALAVFSRDPTRRFSSADVESLELLGGMAAASLVGVERARLDGALLAARTAQHELKNRLMVLMTYTEVLGRTTAPPAELRDVAADAIRCIEDAAELLDKLAGVTQLTEVDWGPNLRPTLDLAQP